MPLRILPLILVVGIQAARVNAQHTDPGTGYWYEGVVTHGHERQPWCSMSRVRCGRRWKP